MLPIFSSYPLFHLGIMIGVMLKKSLLLDYFSPYFDYIKMFFNSKLVIRVGR
jgi:hypothetical protein